ncbi:PRC-barrel domain-containing protein [Pararobbsia alpina]|uniref:Uncharacterized protein n=1 Tax=Pararobbsia alpina TaxID=621374 RepID=A0A6S7BP55_9BURK|nr:PRC-barrel domain-containing protein [Pararobbsia alpina]CAB3791459.1 hypothetical protein LMG28138_03159 [Pararobbsia alpina]
MSGGFSRLVARWYLCAAFLLVFLSGCTVFTREPAPIAEVHPCAAPDASTPVSGAASTGCLETLPPPAPEPIVVPEPVPEVADETPEAKQHPRKPRRVVPKPVPPPPPAPPPVAAPPPVPAPIISMRRLEPTQAHGLLDSEVQRPDGKVIGRAIDLVVDSAGRPNEIIVNLTGFLGVGDRKMNFPLSAFRFNTTAAKKVPITLTIPRGAPPSVAQVKQKSQTASESPPTLAMSDTKALRRDGGKVGRVVDVLIDGAAEPQAVVLDVSNSIGHDVLNIAVNWSALHFIVKDKALSLMLEMSEAQVKAAPPYAADKPVDAVSPIVPVASVAPASSPAPSPASAPASSPRSPR